MLESIYVKKSDELPALYLIHFIELFPGRLSYATVHCTDVMSYLHVVSSRFQLNSQKDIVLWSGIYHITFL